MIAVGEGEKGERERCKFPIGVEDDGGACTLVMKVEG